jgi:phage terminase small subunit
MSDETEKSIKKISVKRKRFIEEYLVDFNGAQAAIRAGYSQRVAKEIAYELLTLPHLKEEVEHKIAELTEQAKLRALDYWTNLAEVLRFDPSALFDENGIAKDIKDIPEHIRKSLKGYKIKNRVTNDGKDAFSEVDFQYPDRLAAIKELGAALKISGDPAALNLNQSFMWASINPLGPLTKEEAIEALKESNDKY